MALSQDNRLSVYIYGDPSVCVCEYICVHLCIYVCMCVCVYIDRDRAGNYTVVVLGIQYAIDG